MLVIDCSASGHYAWNGLNWGEFYSTGDGANVGPGLPGQLLPEMFGQARTYENRNS
jgi:hypothetical protein